MGRAAPDRAPLPRGKGAGRSPKAGGRPGPRPRICGPGQTKSPAAAGPTGRANARQNASPVRTIPSAPEFHRFSRGRWGRSSRAFTAGGDLHPALKQPHYTTPHRRAQRFFSMPGWPGGAAREQNPRGRAAGRTCGERGAGPGQPGTRTGPARRSAARALRFLPRRRGGGLPRTVCARRRRRLAANGMRAPQAAVCARLSTRCAGRSWCAGSRAPCGCRAFRGTSRRAP